MSRHIARQLRSRDVAAPSTVGRVRDTAAQQRQDLEQQADRAADAAVAGAPVHQIGARRQSGAAPAGNAPAGSAGHALDDGTRASMEQRFGADFSQVRIHTDGAAARSADDMGALAYAQGNNIAFAAGQFRPRDHGGVHLLAHELAHVLQQRDGAPPLQRKDKTPPPDPLRYDPTQFIIAPLEKRIPLADAQAMSQDKVTAGELTAASVSGAKSGSDEEIMLHVILAQVSQRDRWGTEVDIVAPIGFPPGADQEAPVGKVTVRIDTKGKGEAVLVSTGAVSMPATQAKREDAEKALKSRYGIAKIQDTAAKWTVGELNLVLGAFARVPAADLSALKGVVLERVSTMSGDGDSAGEFSANQSVEGTEVVNDAVLRLADSVFPSAQAGFIGGKGNEAAPGYLTILHEVGHAVATKARRDAMQAQYTATAERNKAVEKHSEAVDTEAAEASAEQSVVGEYNTLVGEANAANAALTAAKKTGDKDAIAAAKTDRDDKVKALGAKSKEVTAQKSKLASAKADAKAKKAKVDTATSTEEKATKKAEESTARQVLLTRAATTQTSAAAALKRASGQAGARTDDSAGFRGAVDTAGKALAALTDAVKKDANVDDALTAARDAVGAAETAQGELTNEHPDDAALGTFSAVVTAQRACLDAYELAFQLGAETRRVGKFVAFVLDRKIEPFTEYARDNWPANPEEFYSEAYALFLADPEYLRTNSAALHGWFAAGNHR